MIRHAKKYINELANIKSEHKYLVYFACIFPLITFLGSAVINIYVILASIFFLIKTKNIRNYLLPNKFFLILLFFWLSLITNSLFSDNFSDSAERALGFGRFILFIFFIVFILDLQNKKYQKNIYQSWFIFFLIVSFDLFFEKIFGFDIIGNVSPQNARLSSFMGEELKIGHYYYVFYLLSISFIYKYLNTNHYKLLTIRSLSHIFKYTKKS
jgi:hypothetical protein